jgi:hypothetical protein
MDLHTSVGDPVSEIIDIVIIDSDNLKNFLDKDLKDHTIVPSSQIPTVSGLSNTIYLNNYTFEAGRRLFCVLKLTYHYKPFSLKDEWIDDVVLITNASTDKIDYQLDPIFEAQINTIISKLREWNKTILEIPNSALVDYKDSLTKLNILFNENYNFLVKRTGRIQNLMILDAITRFISKYEFDKTSSYEPNDYVWSKVPLPEPKDEDDTSPGDDDVIVPESTYSKGGKKTRTNVPSDFRKKAKPTDGNDSSAPFETFSISEADRTDVAVDFENPSNILYFMYAGLGIFSNDIRLIFIKSPVYFDEITLDNFNTLYSYMTPIAMNSFLQTSRLVKMLSDNRLALENVVLSAIPYSIFNAALSLFGTLVKDSLKKNPNHPGVAKFTNFVMMYEQNLAVIELTRCLDTHFNEPFRL